MNWETKSGGAYHESDYPWSEMVREKRYEYFTTYRKYYQGGGWYRVTVLNWELDKINGKIQEPKKVMEGTRMSTEARRRMIARRNGE